MKKNNRKPKNNKNPRKKARNVSTASAVDAASVSAPQKRTHPNGKPSRAVQKAARPSKADGRGGRGAFFKSVGLFLRQAKVELKKVKWPTRKELIASTVVVIILTILVDFGLIKIIKHVIG
jgi:preprotein translocase subunit SecE